MMQAWWDRLLSILTVPPCQIKQAAGSTACGKPVRGLWTWKK
jgi:hypothetical protein